VSQRVLIIDDEAEIRRNLTFGLTQEGYSCTACPDGISAIHELYRSREQGQGYDYLISDIFMPDIDGLKILKVIKRTFPDLPVLIITGFGDERIEAEALAQPNTGFLDKPFEIPQLVEALQGLKAGATTANGSDVAEEAEIREVMTAYVTLRITDPARDMELYRQLSELDGVASCDAVRGAVDIICQLEAANEGEIEALEQKIRSLAGLEVVSLSRVERPKLDRDVHQFIRTYKEAINEPADQEPPDPSALRSYVIVDIDKEYFQQVFTTLTFLDEVLFCDMVDDGTKLIGIISEVGAFGKTPRIIEKLSQIDGVLRVKEASIIKLEDM
jgi:two-component system cell cycle response regulator CpdR